MLLADEEPFVPFKEFPWLKEASVEELLHVPWSQQHHLH